MRASDQTFLNLGWNVGWILDEFGKMEGMEAKIEPRTLPRIPAGTEAWM